MLDLFLSIKSQWGIVLTGLAPLWPILLVATGVEVIWAGRKLHWPTVVANCVYIPIGLTLSIVALGSMLEGLQAYTPFDVLGIRQWAHTPVRKVLLWLGYLISFDFLYYWLHRAQHRLPWLWRFHMVHHSDVNVSASTVGRHHWLEEGFRYFFITAPLIVLMGGAKEAPVWVFGFILLNGIFMHWNVSFRFGLLERFLITPSYHRLHHSIEERHYDTNFGVFTQLWDRLFGTRQIPNIGDYPATGIVGMSSMQSWVLLSPWPIFISGKDSHSK